MTERFCSPSYPSTLPQVSFQASAAGYSVVGIRHQANEDRFFVDSCRGLFLVTDGMGGMRGGERAAQMAVELLVQHPSLYGCDVLDDERVRVRLGQAFLDVNSEILDEANRDASCYGMGTTAVLGLLCRDRLYFANLGDSRAYLFRKDELIPYTVDHSLAQTLAALGAITREAAREHRWRHLLWKYVGLPDLKDGPDLTSFRIQAGDRVVLTTDGVTGVLEPREMMNVLNSHATPTAAAEGLVRAAVACGTRDDATAVVVNFASRESEI
jgi:protein phosphatase